MRRLRMLTVAVLVAPSLVLLAVGARTHPAAATATGGDTVADVDVAGTTYRVHTFTTVGTQNLVVTAPVTVEVLLVAGGGGGGTRDGTTGQWAGGGGAGGMLEATETLTAGTYPIVVGAGGAGGSGATRQGSKGGDSTALGRTAVGGGGGAASSTGAITDGGAGGSGGGGAHDGGAGDGGTGVPGQGSDGGDGHQPTPGSCPDGVNGCGGGGGGGAGSAGGAASDSTGGDGGAGRVSDITGVAVTYAGGGGGGGHDEARSGAGGAGGGGAGMAKGGASGAGAANTGGGAGAGPYAGGSGIVVVRYALPATAPAPVEVAPPSFGCAGTPAVGSAANCSVTGLPVGFEVLWRASIPAGEIASGVLVADDDGTATLTFALPPVAVGTPVTVELVDWTAPILIGIAEGPVPNAVDAGALGIPGSRGLLAALLAMLGFGSLVRKARARAARV